MVPERRRYLTYTLSKLHSAVDDKDFMRRRVPRFKALFMPATIGLFPLLYAIWPKRTRFAFIYVMIVSAIGGFFSPFLYMCDPPSKILEPFHIFIGIIGMTSAAMLAPLYFQCTRRPGTISEPQP
jgi:hypothetical protein